MVEEEGGRQGRFGGLVAVPGGEVEADRGEPATTHVQGAAGAGRLPGLCEARRA